MNQHVQLLIWYTKSCEGGPDIEHVCGLFESIDKALVARETFRSAVRGNLPDSLDDETFSMSPVDAGPVVVFMSYDFHGESQNELLKLVADVKEAEILIAKLKAAPEEQSERDPTYTYVEYTLNNVVLPF